MRDILVTLIVFGSLPFIFRRPYVGVLMWVWISVMNPHTQGWGFATSFPFAAIIAATTLLSMLGNRDAQKNLPNTAFVWMLLAFVLWMNVTTLFALQPEPSFEMWKRVMKIMLMTFVTLMLIKSKEQIRYLIWMIVISIGFYGVKGGIFTIESGGSSLVWGPGNTFIGGNNEIALALIMTIPLMHYLQTTIDRKWIRHALTAAMGLSAIAALGSYSRGALLAIAAMSAFLWLKSRHKLSLALLVLPAIPLAIMFMPDKWGDRMDTIAEYGSDLSAQGRFNAWQMAYHLANDRPLVGGGFEIYEHWIFQIYAPNPDAVHAAHSIYFQALGEHGYVGLALYLLLALLTWRNGSWIIRRTKHLPDYKWAENLARMVQVSMVGFGVGGAFLSLLYFDVPYYLMAAMIATRVLIAKELGTKSAPHTARTSPIARQPRPATRPAYRQSGQGVHR